MYRTVENMGSHDGRHVVRLRVYYRTSVPSIISEGVGSDFESALDDAFLSMDMMSRHI